MTPGYAKYFLDLGYNINIILNSIGQDAFCLFEDITKIKLFIFSDLNQIENKHKFN